MQTKKLIQVGIVTSIFVAAVVSFYASSNPDGLEYVAEQVGFLNTAKDSAVAGSPFADYSIIGINNERISVAIAGVLGVGLTALISFGLFFFIKRK